MRSVCAMVGNIHLGRSATIKAMRTNEEKGQASSRDHEGRGACDVGGYDWRGNEVGEIN